jgi:hypothetical protein
MKKIKKGTPVKLKGIATRGADTDGFAHIRIKGTKLDKAISVNIKDLRKKLF